MIILVEGKIVKRLDQDRYSFVDIITKNGVGYRVNIPSRLKIKVDQEVSIHTSFQVREDSQTLYGFDSMFERDFFELLLTVSGIGPKSALAILSEYTANQVASYILSGNHAELSKVPGLGKKTSQKVVLELENKLGDYDIDFSDTKVANKLLIKELKEALRSLGFSGETLEQYVKKGEKYSKEVESIDELIKLVLKQS